MRSCVPPLGLRCPLAWDELQPLDGTRDRWCGQCQKIVHVVTSLRALQRNTRFGLCSAFFTAEWNDLADNEVWFGGPGVSEYSRESGLKPVTDEEL